ncbi:reverse transcriptase-like protein [Vagococcus penaei]|nr:reverse transcriptase-like protein [Vagococcus penaei]
MLKIYIDAATHPKKEQSAGGMVLVHNGQQSQLKIPLLAPNNHLAEFEILEYALTYCLTHHLEQETIFLYSDSKIVVQSLDKHHVQNSDFKSIFERILALLPKFPMLLIDWIPEKK